MATSKPITRVLRLVVVATTSALAVGLAPGTGHAAPPQTVAEARKQITALNSKLEPVIEQYNAAQITLTKTKAAQRAATLQAQQLNGRLQALSGKVRQMASSAYRSVPFGEFTTIMTSSSPQDFLDQLSALDIVSRRRASTIASLTQARSQAQQAQQKAKKAAATAQRLFTGLRAQKASIEKQVAQTQAVLSRLTAAQRAAVFDDGARASRSTVRVPVGNPNDLSGLPAPPNAKAKTAVSTALAQRGDPYLWAAAGPNQFDCSGLTMYAWAAAGVSLPHQSAQQYGAGRHISRSELLPGDLVFFYSPISHVGMYIGNGLIVHAPTSGDVVKVSDMSLFPYAGAARYW